MNKMGQQPLIFLNFLWLLLGLGILAASSGALSFSLVAFVIVVIIFLSAILILRSSSKAGYALGLLFLFLGAIRYMAAAQLPADDVSHYVGASGQVTGIVAEMPEEQEDSAGHIRVRYIVAAESWQENGQDAQAVQGKLYVSAAAAGDIVASLGDRITAEGRLLPLRGYGNPGIVDTVQQAANRGITARLTAQKGTVSIQQENNMPLRRFLAGVRQHYLTAMQQVMPKEEASAVFAMLFGGYNGIRPEVLQAFTATGIIHILSVSGSHITLLAGVLAWLGLVLHLPRRLTAALVTAAIVFYGALAGASTPVLRSGIMGILAYWGVALAREKDARLLLSLAGIFLLLWQPGQLFDISSQLSFSAAAGLFYLAPLLRAKMSKYLPELMAGSLSVTLGAQLFSLPILAWYFHTFSLSSLAANLLVVPWIELIIVAALAAGVLSFLLPAAAKIIFMADSLVLGLVYELSRFLSLLPGSFFYLPAWGNTASICYYLLLFFFCQEAAGRNVVKAFCCRYRQVVLFLCIAGLSVLAYQAWQPGRLTVHFIDVGQGNAALLVTPHGHAFMIDTGGVREGTFDVGGRVDVPYLLHYDIHRLDYIFLTHAHEDHAAGAGGILSKLPVGQIWTAGEGENNYLKSMQIPLGLVPGGYMPVLRQGQVFMIDGVRVQVIYAPQVKQLDKDRQYGNECSNVLRVSYGSVAFLFTGDLPEKQEEILLEDSSDLQADILQVGHHGSKTSTSAAFLQAVRPRWSVVSVGADNTFGHPASEVIERLNASGSAIYRTDQDGAVVFSTDGRRVWASSFRR